jgi:predicted CXXCH cytochrome family protein
MKGKNFMICKNVIRLLLLSALLSTFLVAQKKVNQCYICHESNGDKQALLFKNDIHSSKGITCADCHGGDALKSDMDEAMSKDAGFKGIPKGDAKSEVCGRCHNSSTEMAKYNSSVKHGQLDDLKSSSHGKLTIKGDERIAQCTTCHNAHGIVSVKSPASPVYPLNVVKTCSRCHSDKSLIKQYNPSLPTDQFENYQTSVHGKLNGKGDAKTAECASCHGSHLILPAKDIKSQVYAANVPMVCSKCHSDADLMKPYGIPTDQFAKYSNSVHGIALLKKGDVAAPACNDCHGNHGATPPGLESISKVCGTCHVLNADLFSQSPHKKAFDDRKIPECETCHGNHEILTATSKLIGTTPDAVCVKCHSQKENTKGYIAAADMRKLLDSLSADEQTAIKLIEDAETKGMEVSEPKYQLRSVRQTRLEAKTIIHAFDRAKLSEVTKKGFVQANEIKAEGKSAVDEFYFRRWGLILATLIISSVAVMLYIFIRRMEKKNK